MYLYNQYAFMPVIKKTYEKKINEYFYKKKKGLLYSTQKPII